MDYRWRVFIAVAIGLFTSVFDAGTVTVALPSISEYFHTELPTAQWVVIGYGLTIAALLLPMGRLSDLVGRKRVYLLGFVVFIAGGLLSAMSTHIFWLIGAKVIQGVGSAMNQGTGIAMIISSFGEKNRGKSLGLIMSIVGVGGVAGPAAGGVLVGLLGWQSVLYTTSFMGLVSAIASLLLLDADRHRGVRTATDEFDWFGAALSSCVLLFFLVAMTLGSRVGWDDMSVLVCFIAFVVALGLFIFWELRTSSPMMDVRLFKVWIFSTGVACNYISFIGMQSIRFLVPFYLQMVLKVSPTVIGWLIVPSAICLAIMGPLSGRLSDRYGWIVFNIAGMVISAGGLLILCTLKTDSSLTLVVIGMVIQSIGIGIFNAPNNSSVLSVVAPARYGVVSGFLQLVRNSGNVTGVAVATAIVTSVMVTMGYPPTMSAINENSDIHLLYSFTKGLKATFIFCAVLLFASAILPFSDLLKKSVRDFR